MRGVRTGFKDLDNMLAGLQKSDLIILAARPSVGKTSLALDIARQTAVQHTARGGHLLARNVGQQLIDRMVAAEAKVNSWNLRTGHINDQDDWDRIRDAYDRLGQAPIYIATSRATTSSRCARWRAASSAKTALGSLLSTTSSSWCPRRARQRLMVQQVTEISRSLKNLARELDVPVLGALAAEPRGRAARRQAAPLDLRDSGSIEQDADVVMFIHRDDKKTKRASAPTSPKS
jgi:replicative DNA helicase